MEVVKMISPIIIMSRNSFHKLVIFSACIILLAACSVERKIAKAFVAKPTKGAVLVLSPETIYRINLKDTVNPGNMDSTIYLNKINEYALIGISLTNLKNELIKLGFDVYDDSSLDEYMKRGDSSYVLKLSQVELEEGIDYTLLYGDNTSPSKIDSSAGINFVNINSWFEFGRKNVVDENFPLLYCSFSLTDSWNGEYMYTGSGLAYAYEIDTLSIAEFSQLPDFLGKKYASYFYDYVMNIYILENLPEDFNPTYYYHYNPQNKVIQIHLDEEDHFIEMEKN